MEKYSDKMEIELINDKMEIELIKKDEASITHLLEKHDSTIEKMQNVATELSKIVSLQEQKLQSHERTHMMRSQELEKMRNTAAKDLKELNEKIYKVQFDLTAKIEQTESAILSEIKKLKTDTEEINSGLANKITSIELWRYGIMGAVAFAVFLLTKFIDIAKFFS